MKERFLGWDEVLGCGMRMGIQDRELGREE